VLLGDLGEKAQSALRRRIDVPRVQVVKVSHHGSADQDPALYRALHPTIGLIGVGADNDYGHPTAKLLNILSALGTTAARTDRDGAIAVWLDEDGRLTLWRERAGAGADSTPPTGDVGTDR
jgi:competence protein ComEC